MKKTTKYFSIPLYIGLASVMVYIILQNKHTQKAHNNIDTNLMQITSYDGNTWSLSAYKGKPLLINFWSSSCAPCIKEIPDLVELWQKYYKQVNFIGLAIESPVQDVIKIVQNNKIPYQIAKVDYEDFAHLNPSQLLPATYLLDAKGNIRWHKIGTISKERLEKQINDIYKTHLSNTTENVMISVMTF